MFPGHHRRIRLLYGAADLFLIAVAFQLAYWTRSQIQLENNFYIERAVRLYLLLGSAFSWVAIASWFEIYDRIEGTHPRVILRDAFRQSLLGAIAIVLLEYIARLDLSRPFVAMFAVYAWILLCLFRLNAGRFLIAVRRRTHPHYVMIVGLGEAARRLGQQFEEAAITHGVRLRGFFDDGLAAKNGRRASDSDSLPRPVHGSPGVATQVAASSVKTVQLSQSYPVYPLAQLPEMLREHVIDEIVFTADSRQLAELEEILLICDEEGVRTRIAVNFFPHVNSRVHLEHLGNSPLLTFSATPHDEIRLLVKRVTDVVLAGAALILLLPVMLIVALIIRLTSPGPAIFRQERCGLNGRRFMFYKFRSMCENADEMRASVAHLSQRDLAWKIPNDPRLTPVGRWLRKFSIDEWPQLWNVLRGDMSLVGPRPPIPEEVEQYKRWQRRRLRMRPGLTCLWAVSGRDAVDFETWMKMDMEYIDNWSLALDWKIILRTIPSILSGRGAS